MRRLPLLAALGICLAQSGGAFAGASDGSPDQETGPAGLSATIHVTGAKSLGACPRSVTAQATIWTSDPVGTRHPIRYRFTKNGTPITEWQRAEAGKDGSLDLSHIVQVEARDSRRVSIPVATGQDLVERRSSYRTKSTIGIEASTVGHNANAITVLAVRCLDEAIAAHSPIESDARPDLTLAGGLRIGRSRARSGGTLVLRERDILSRTSRGCRFRFSYEVANTGDIAAAAHASRLTQGAIPVAAPFTPPLAANRTRRVAGQLVLAPGDSVIRLRLDPFLSIREENESNNTFSARVTVPRTCDRLRPGRPARQSAIPGVAPP